MLQACHANGRQVAGSCLIERMLNVLQVALEESRQGTLSDRLRAIDAVNLEKKRDLTAAGLRKNREGNKGTAAGHD